MNKNQYESYEEKMIKKNKYDLIGAIGFLGLFFIRLFIDSEALNDTFLLKAINSVIPAEWGGATTFCGFLGIVFLMKSLFSLCRCKQ